MTKFKGNGDGECPAHEERDAILLWVVKRSVCAVDVWFPRLDEFGGGERSDLLFEDEWTGEIFGVVVDGVG